MTDPTAASGHQEHALLTSTTPTVAHLSRLAQLGEQLAHISGELVELLHHDGVTHDLNGAEHDALRAVASAVRTAGGDVALVATAAHHRLRLADA
ncbi:hypothetical protein [Micromonospora sp. RV43]|jgi:hypothetical protein|uniref:hypothetical protein n=1 Tax=Micromonospora sp. RV43 TaxID=1661387 RepID=UPI00064B9699|nr:hypothetical protein [Micromonospora sp. RV43]